MHRIDRASWFATVAIILIIGTIMPVLDFADSYSPVNDRNPIHRRGNVRTVAVQHDPLVIDGDVNFTNTALAENWPGNGTSGNPIIIQGLTIDLAGMPGHGISISNTRVHFVICDSILTGADVYPGSGIRLYNISNGVLFNNSCPSNSHIGIHLRSSNSNILINNTCTGNTNIGIYLESSNSNTLTNNTCTGNDYGIELLDSHFNTLLDSTCPSNSYGILLENSDSNIISDNTCASNTDVGIHLQVCNSNTLTNNTCTSNGHFGIFLYSSVSNLAISNICSNGNNGIGFLQSNSNTMVNNTISDNSENGVEFNDSDFNTLANNSCRNNQIGVYLLSGSDNNTIHWNVFSDNLDNGVMGSFQFGNVFDYNYWSDYVGIDADANGIGDVAYTYSGITDLHPLIYLPTPPRWTEQPFDQIVEFWFSELRYDLNITCPSPITWHLNHKLFSVDNQGVVTTFTILPVDIYHLEISVINIYGSVLLTSLLVTVLDTSTPGWLIFPADQILRYGESLDYQVAAIDPSGIDHWEINDTTRFALETSFYFDGSTARITNGSFLEPGSYALNLTVFDIFANKLSAVFSIIVETTTIAPTTTSTLTTTEPFFTTPVDLDPVLTLALGVGIGGAAVFVIVMIFLRRKS